MQRKPEKLAEFEDRYGDSRVIHRKPNGVLAVARQRATVSHALGKWIGQYVGRRIREERLARGFTMDEVMIRAGLLGGKSRMYEIEQAQSIGIRLGTLYAMAAALEVDVTSLLPPAAEVMEHAQVQEVRQPVLNVM